MPGNSWLPVPASSYLQNLLRQLLLPGFLSWHHSLWLLEANLKILGAMQGENFLLVGDLDRCWMAGRLARRALPHNPLCPLRDQHPETMPHLLVDCSFSQQIWLEALSWIQATCSTPVQGTRLTTWWLEAKKMTPNPLHKGFASMILFTSWMLWKQRNECSFEGVCPCLASLLSSIWEEAKLWVRIGALGLGLSLPSTWDVH